MPGRSPQLRPTESLELSDVEGTPGVIRPQFPPRAGIPFVPAQHRLLSFLGLPILTPSAGKFFLKSAVVMFSPKLNPRWVLPEAALCLFHTRNKPISSLPTAGTICTRQAPCRALCRAGYLIGESDEYTGRSPSGVVRLVLIDLQSAGRQVGSGGPPPKLRLTPR